MCHHHRRPAFTLIELLVVMTIMIFLSTLVLLFFPRLQEQQRASKGADQLTSWLLNAKMNALRTGRPRGVRMVVVQDPAKPPGNFLPVREFLYIEQPDDFQASPGFVDPMTGQAAPARRLSVQASTGKAVLDPLPTGYTGAPAGDFWGGQIDQTLFPVQPGDYLELQGGGLLHRIAKVQDALTLILSSAPEADITSTLQYRVIRGPRVLTGEAPLKLPDGVGIDLSACQPQGSPNGTPDFLFAPSGTMLNAPGGQGKTILWVADVTQDTVLNAGYTAPFNSQPFYMQNGPVLLAITTNSGFISTCPVDVTGPTPYTFAGDARSGL